MNIQLFPIREDALTFQTNDNIILVVNLMINNIVNIIVARIVAGDKMLGLVSQIVCKCK